MLGLYLRYCTLFICICICLSHKYGPVEDKSWEQSAGKPSEAKLRVNYDQYESKCTSEEKETIKKLQYTNYRNSYFMIKKHKINIK